MHNSTAFVDVSIVDTNDNNPVFDSQFYNASIPEKSLPGTEVQNFFQLSCS